MQKSVFLDRDGVLNADFGYTYKVEDLQWIEGSQEALYQLKTHGYLLFVVSNQSGIARGFYTEADVIRFHNAMQVQLHDTWKIKIDAFYFCPHLKEEDGAKVEAYTKDCDCRKPNIGMIRKACQEHSVDLKRSFMIGDKSSDMECAHRAGLRGIQVGKAQRCSTLKEALTILLV